MRALFRTVLPALLVLVLVACGSDTPAPAVDASAAVTTTATTPDLSTADAEAARARAAESLAANRLFAPAGDNAIEHYLALLATMPADTAAMTALIDLAPYVTIAAEQATAARDFAEAERLIDLLRRMDPEAPALPRLQAALAAERAAAEAEAEALQQTEIETQVQTAQATAALASAARAAEATRTAAAAAAALTTAAAATNVAAAPARVPARPAVLATPTDVTPPVASPSAAPPAVAAAVAAPVTAAPRAVVSRVAARFPESALRRQLEGEVELAVLIRADGSVASVEVLRADPPGVFDREALRAVQRWRYAPAATESRTRVVVQFRRP